MRVVWLVGMSGYSLVDSWFAGSLLGAMWPRYSWAIVGCFEIWRCTKCDVDTSNLSIQ